MAKEEIKYEQAVRELEEIVEKMENDELDIVNVYDNYVLKLECGVKKILVKLETPDSPAQYEDRVIFKIARRTYIEEQLHQLGL